MAGHMSKIIDAHAHIFPGKIAERASESIRDFYDLDMRFAGYPHALVESGSKIGRPARHQAAPRFSEI